MRLLQKPLLAALLHKGLAKPAACIFALWILVNSFFLVKDGIVTTGEASKYISIAHLFLETGHLPSSNFWFYSIPIFLISFCLKFRLGFGLVVAVQLLFNLAATLYFYNTCADIFDSKKRALAGTIVLLLNYPYQAFNTFVQTESLFHSFSLLLSCYLLRKEKLFFHHLFFIIFSLLILSMSRPIGLLYLPAALLCFFFVFLNQASLGKRLGFLTVFTLVFLCLLNTAIGSGGEFDFMLPFREEHIICGTPTLLYPRVISSTGDGNSLYSLFFYISHNPGQFLRLATLKSFSFWGVCRSYFSAGHNLYLVVYFYSIMAMAIFSLQYWRRYYPYKLLYLLILILITWGTVIMTCDDWSNRIYLSITPYLIILGTAFGRYADTPKSNVNNLHL